MQQQRWSDPVDIVGAEDIYERVCSSIGITGEEETVLFETRLLSNELRNLVENIARINTEVQAKERSS